MKEIIIDVNRRAVEQSSFYAFMCYFPTLSALSCITLSVHNKNKSTEDIPCEIDFRVMNYSLFPLCCGLSRIRF